LVTETFERARCFRVDVVSYEPLEVAVLMPTLVRGKLRRGVAEAERDKKEICDMINKTSNSIMQDARARDHHGGGVKELISHRCGQGWELWFGSATTA
jgi:hypothetical protein